MLKGLFSRYLVFILVLLASGLTAPVAFRLIEDRQVAALVAGFQFCVWPLAIAIILQFFPIRYLTNRSQEVSQKLRRNDLLLLVVILQFWTFFAMPILLARLINWNVPFNEIKLPIATPAQLHQWSLYSYTLMLVVHVILLGQRTYLENRK